MKRDFYNEEFVGWLARAVEASPPGIVAYYVGLFETPDGCTVYLTGSGEFDPDNEDWVGNEDYAPREKYLALPEKMIGARDWRRVQGRVIRAVKAFLASPEHEHSPLARAAAVAVGFDDGDRVRVK